MLPEIGPVKIAAPPDTNSSFEPQSSRGQRRLTEIDEIVLPLTAKGLTIGEVAAHVAEVYGGDGVQGRHVPDHRQGEG